MTRSTVSGMAHLDDGLLAGKVVLVTGGTQGLGAAVATAAARNGADVVVTGRRAPVGEEFAAGLAQASGRQVRYVRADAGDVAASQASVAQTIGWFGRVDCLVTAPHSATLTAVVTEADDVVRDRIGQRIGFSVSDARDRHGAAADRVGFSWAVVNANQELDGI